MAKKDRLQLVRVAVPIPSNQAFLYAVPEDQLSGVRAGVRVLVPFGPRTHVGLVLGEASSVPDQAKIREILQVLDASPLLSPQLIELGDWLSRYYRRQWERRSGSCSLLASSLGEPGKRKVGKPCGPPAREG